MNSRKITQREQNDNDRLRLNREPLPCPHPLAPPTKNIPRNACHWWTHNQFMAIALIGVMPVSEDTYIAFPWDGTRAFHMKKDAIFYSEKALYQFFLEDSEIEIKETEKEIERLKGQLSHRRAQTHIFREKLGLPKETSDASQARSR